MELGCNPNRIKNLARYLIAGADVHREKDFIVLNSIRKSGTNYFRLILANYIAQKYFGAGQIEYGDLIRLFPNERKKYLSKKRSRIPYQSPPWPSRDLPYRDFVYSHNTYALNVTKGRVIFLFRNPLDYIISNHFYVMNNPNNQLIQEGDPPQKSIDWALDIYIQHYALMIDLCRSKQNFISLSYEELTTAPDIAMSMVIRWLGLRLDTTVLRQAAAHSDIKEIRKYEEKNGPIHAPEGFKGSFARSGKIGQWQRYFDTSDVNYIKSRLSSGRISLDEFVIT